MKDKINIIAIDDHQIILDGLEYSLKDTKNIEFIYSTTNKQDFLNKLNTIGEYVNIAIVDLNLNDNSKENITSLCIEIKKQYHHIKILVLTTYGGKKLISKLKQASIDGYISKNHSKEELQRAIITLWENKQYYQEYLEENINEELEDNYRYKIDVSDREKEILLHIKEGKTNKQIAEILFISSYTVKTHRQNLRKKFNVNTSSALIAKAIQFGII